MPRKMWMIDLAREQCPTVDHMRRWCRFTLEAGFDSLGLYLEHRFAYPSAPWGHGQGAITPEMVQSLEREFPELELVPFINLLGHCEGFLYVEEGSRFCEERFTGLQASPASEEFRRFAERILEDTIQCFQSEWIHLGGDETAQLGTGKSRYRLEELAAAGGEGTDAKAALYAEHFAPLLQRTRQHGRAPCIWGDMLLEHPAAIPAMGDAVVFDWQYFGSPLETSRKLQAHGLPVVVCPALLTYNAVWMHMAESEENVRAHVAAAAELGAAGVCVTTWEQALFGNQNTLMGALTACGDLLNGRETSFLKGYLHRSEISEEWARLMGIELPRLGPPFAWTRIRSGVKCRFLLYGNPFLLWLRHGPELVGETGDAALDLAERALAMAPGPDERGVAVFLRSAVEFARYAENARTAYAQRHPGEAAAALSPARQLFDNLAKTASASHINSGGSLADVERCRVAKEHVERVIGRIKQFGDGSLGYLPSFEHLCHPAFMPHDQGAWWRINRWAYE